LKALLISLLLLLMVGVCFADDDAGEVIQNVCYTESVEVEKGESFPVKVFLANADTLEGMQVPIYYRSEDVKLSCDSITFTDSRCEMYPIATSQIDSLGRVAFFAFVAMSMTNVKIDPLFSGEGLVAILWFTVPEDANSGKVELYSGENAVLYHPKVDYSYMFWTPGPENPEKKDFLYKPGYITVK